MTELSGRVRFVRLSGQRADAFDVPCRNGAPGLVATSRRVAASASSDAGWIIRRYTPGARKLAPVVIVLPDETAQTTDPMLDPFLAGLVGDGADVRMLVYPGSWTAGRLRSGENVSVSNLLEFARSAIASEVDEPTESGPVILMGRGFGALLALHLGSTALAGRVDGLFFEGAMLNIDEFPIAVRRDVIPFGYNDTARGVPVAFLHGSEDRRSSVDIDIEPLMRFRGGGAQMNRCVVIEGMGGRAETAFQWGHQEKLFETLLNMIARAGGSTSRAANKCELVPRVQR